MVMPGRITTLSGGPGPPGSTVLSTHERPVPATRRFTPGSNYGNPLTRDGDPSSPSSPGRSQNFMSAGMRNRTPSPHRRPQQEPSTTSYTPHHLYQQRTAAYSNTQPLSPPPGVSRPISAVRPQSAMAVTSPNTLVAERPPSSLSIAWSANQRGQQPQLATPRLSSSNTNDVRQPHGSGQESLESRLKSLVTSSDSRDERNTQRYSSGTDWQARHHQAQASFHQRSKSYGDDIEGAPASWNMASDSTVNTRDGDVYAVINKGAERRQSHEAIPGYVAPSRLNDVDQSLGQPHNQQDRRDNSARHGPPNSNSPRGYDLRSAWERLYGNRPNSAVSPPGARTSSSYEGISNPETHRLQVKDANYLQQQQADKYDTTGPNKISQIALQSTVNSSQPLISNKSNIGSKTQSQQSLSGSQHSLGPPGVDILSSGLRVKNSDYSFGASSAPFIPHSPTGRESPTGQSSSNPEQVSGSNNSSQLSTISENAMRLTTFKPERKKWNSVDLSADPTTALGPAAKYPDFQPSNQSGLFAQSSENRSPPRHSGSHWMHHRPSTTSPYHEMQGSVKNQPESPISEGTVEFTVSGEMKRPHSRQNLASNFFDSDNDDYLTGDYPLNPLDSVFDYPAAYDDEGEENGYNNGGMNQSDKEGSVSPPLPPLTQENPGHIHHPRDTMKMSRSTAYPHQLQSPSASRHVVGHTSGKGKQAMLRVRQPEESAEFGRGKTGRHHSPESPRHHKQSLIDYARSRSLEDVRESGNESVLSFDVENTVLLVEPSDQSEMGTLRSQTAGSSVRAQLNRLEGMYSQVMRSLEERPRPQNTSVEGSIGGSRTRRRWSIGSSDTSSMRMRHHHRHSQEHGGNSSGNHPGRGAGSGAGITGSGRMNGRDARAIGKRFQRLESHVITLARSVAHLSSELRSHNSVTREMENVKREIRELKSSRDGDRGGYDRFTPQAPGHFMAGENHRQMTEFERYRGWVPSLTNPRRVNKLTKFFGQEPPLLEIFMKRLGYEKYVKNFEEEHIGMIELPYMTEDRLKSIGIPMGPRLRILQEAQMYFQQGNFDVYFV